MRARNLIIAILSTVVPAVASDTGNLQRIDAHVHVFAPDPGYAAFLERNNLRVLNICVLDKHEKGFEQGVEPQHRAAREVFKISNGRAAWCSSFDDGGFERPGFAHATESALEKTFREGAVAVKIYKDIGMELKSRDGKYVMPDNLAFAPVLDFIAGKGRTLFAHIAEPSAAWRPLDPNSPHYGYYRANPDWHMYQHPEHPRKETILAARDRMLKLHPNLKVVGCHLGSLEDDVDEIAKRLDAYPNFAVDTAARIPDLMRQPAEKVRRFLLKYQDRVLYGTDLVLMPGEDAAKAIRHMEEEYARDWKYFSGLGLPEPVLRRLFHENAVRWVPGIVR